MGMFSAARGLLSAAVIALVPLSVGGVAAAQTAQEQAAFDSFRGWFRAEAIDAGVSAATYDREMATARFVPVVLERNANQPEFTRAIWDYVDSAASARRIADGRAAIAREAASLTNAESRYGVDREIMGAIWGLESSYGRIMGDRDIISSLATLAYDGRRARFGRNQLIGALKIIDNGYATRNQLKGSWAGAMGQTQFIPTTYLAYAVDENGDGRRDLWADSQDVFASTANYLARSKYRPGQPWGIEVTLPRGFDFSEASLRTRKSVAVWQSVGVDAARGGLADRADLNASASIIVPAGASGPAFMVFDNFRAIMRYNNSTSYALGIGLLSEALAGRPHTLVNEWPRGDRPLSLTERKALQSALARAGYNPGPVDGIIGAGTKSALRAWQRANGLPADGYASAATLTAVTGG